MQCNAVKPARPLTDPGLISGNKLNAEIKFEVDSAVTKDNPAHALAILPRDND